MCLGEGVEVSVCLVVVVDSLLRGSTSVHELLRLHVFWRFGSFVGFGAKYTTYSYRGGYVCKTLFMS